MLPIIKSIRPFFRRFRFWILAAVVSIGLVSFREANDNVFELSRNLDIFTTLFRELTIYYVDPLDAESLVHQGIDAMLESLDPYTQYISEDQAEDYRFMTTGEYGGIGALIGQRDNEVVITDPYEGYPAQKGGLIAGDIIRSIDGKATKGKQYDEVSKMLKGQPKTAITLIVDRPGEAKPITKTFLREAIQIKNVPYYGVVNNNVGYIRLSSFTDNAGLEVKDAVVDLTQKKNVKGIIFDLRGNPGGLLNEAVNIVNVFVDKGQEVVSTRGKVKDWDKIYKALNSATDTKTPVVVLVSSGSASAAEIVSGSLQDFDRAVVIGQRTFGKGLVQTTRPLTYNTQLKVTTAKYYIPSGRCIQALDYTHRNPDGSVGKVPDSLKREFKTKVGRKVFDGGGIEPDYAMTPISYSTITQIIANKYLLFDYATDYKIKHPVIAAAKDFHISDAEYSDFVKWLSNKDFEYVTESERKLEELKDKATREHYFDAIKSDYDALHMKLKHNKSEDLITHKEEIKSILENEIVSRYYYQNGRMENSFLSDPEVKLAIRALQDPSVYNSILNRSFKE